MPQNLTPGTVYAVNVVAPSPGEFVTAASVAIGEQALLDKIDSLKTGNANFDALNCSTLIQCTTLTAFSTINSAHGVNCENLTASAGVTCQTLDCSTTLNCTTLNAFSTINCSHTIRAERFIPTGDAIIGSNLNSSYAPVTWRYVHVPSGGISAARDYTIDDTGAADGVEIEFSNNENNFALTIKFPGGSTAIVLQGGALGPTTPNKWVWAKFKRIGGTYYIISRGF